MSGWNAKVRCIEQNLSDFFKLGDFVEIKNGFIQNYEISKRYDSLEHLNNDVYAKFELVSEELPQPHKSLLKDGDYVVDRRGIERIVSLKFEKFMKVGGFVYINEYLDDLTSEGEGWSHFDIMEVYRDGKLIAKRIEKTKEQIELEQIEERLEEIPQKIVEMLNEQTELQKKRSELKERLKWI